jgi:hypothetical protein
VSWQQRSLETQQATARLRMLLEMPSEAAYAKSQDLLRSANTAAGNGQAALAETPPVASPNGFEFSPQQVLALQQSRYGLGDRRTLDQAIAFSGIDTKHRKMRGNHCGNLNYVPFVEHPWGPDYIPVFHNVSEEFLDVRDPGSIYFNEGLRAAWEAADDAHHRHRHQVGSSRVPQSPVLLGVGSSSALGASTPARDTALAKSIQSRQRLVPGRTSIMDTLIENKLMVNFICIALIALIVVSILCLQPAQRKRQTVVRTKRVGDVENNATKDV